VNTTPNPRATKKSNGELVGPPELFGLSLGGDVGDGVDIAVKTGVEAMIVRNTFTVP
jgi:hypothetical protein